jgi:Zn-dependent protease
MFFFADAIFGTKEISREFERVAIVASPQPTGQSERSQAGTALYSPPSRHYLSRVAAPDRGARRPRHKPLHTLQSILLFAPVLLFSVIAHEIAHGYAALRQGDRTALDAGRLSWNPAKHIDPFFTILLPIMTFVGSAAGGRPMIFGGAKPVPVDPRNYRHLRRGDIIVSLAGVATNALIAVACLAAFALAGLAGRAAPALVETLGIIQAMCVIGVQLNALLIAFNLLPIPPLDGSHVFKYLLPARLALAYVRLARYGLLVLIALLAFGDRLLAAWMMPTFRAADWGLQRVVSFALPTAQQWL